ncbi:MAG TPA: hypothetical protein VHR43_05125 [Gemmatimonadales bacterium]|nr:hypothetical protein [Gemmatimonadales bacterium]
MGSVRLGELALLVPLFLQPGLAPGLAPGLPLPAAPPTAPACTAADRVSREDMLRAMARHGAYNLTATTTSMRFGAEALLALVASHRRPVGGRVRLFVDQTDWFSAHRETAGVSYDAMSAAAKAGFEHHQDAVVEYGPDLLEKVEKGPTPLQVLDVTISWPDSAGAPSSFTYRDTLSVPRVEVHDSRVIQFKLVQYEDMLLFDEIRGISVKPMGFLSAIFALVGRPDLKQTRVAVSADQWEVVRGQVKVFPGISKTGTAVIEPGGLGHEDVPAGRADLDSLRRRLERPVKLRYRESC